MEDITLMQRALEVLPIATIVVLALTAVGCIQVVTDDLTFEELIRLLDVPLAGLAVGRGLAARKG